MGMYEPDDYDPTLEYQYLPAQLVHKTERAKLFKNSKGLFWVPRVAIVHEDNHSITVEHWCSIDYFEEERI